jgi:hypothetical protein
VSATEEFEEILILAPGKRLGVAWTPWMGDWFISFSPRNSNGNAEGSWCQWANLAAAILAHPMTSEVAPHLHRTDLNYDASMYDDLGVHIEPDAIRRFVSENGGTE